MSTLAINGGAPLRDRPFPAYPFFGPQVGKAVQRVYRSQIYCSMLGGETIAFEREYADWHGIAHAVASANGTTALQLAVAAAGIGAGDEVLVPAYTYIASAAGVVAQNAVPILVDSETDSHGLDPVDMERKITPRTKAVMPVHINGYPCDLDRVMDLARRHNLIVIEDCSHAHGARYHGKLVGTIGHIGAFSLQHKKNLSVGEGGIAITADPDLAERMAKMRTFGTGAMKYNYRLSEFHAAIGREQLPLLTEMNRQRQANARRLIDRLADIPCLTPLAGLPDTESVYYNCIFLYDQQVTGVHRSRLVKAIMAEGIPLNLFYYPINRDSIMQEANAYGQGCPFACPLRPQPATYALSDNPVATRLCDDVNLEIKVHPPCTEEDMEDIAAAIRKVCDQADELTDIGAA